MAECPNCCPCCQRADEMERENARLREALADYGSHNPTLCKLADWRAGRPTDDGDYETNYGGQWYRRGQHPKCACGLDGLINPPREGE